MHASPLMTHWRSSPRVLDLLTSPFLHVSPDLHIPTRPILARSSCAAGRTPCVSCTTPESGCAERPRLPSLAMRSRRAFVVYKVGRWISPCTVFLLRSAELCELPPCIGSRIFTVCPSGSDLLSRILTEQSSPPSAPSAVLSSVSMSGRLIVSLARGKLTRAVP